MMDRIEIYGLSAVMLLFIGTVNAQSTFIKCYSWDHPAVVNITCAPKKFIRITDMKYGITNSPSNTFCNRPFKDSVHCFERYGQSEMDIALACNMKFQCRKQMPFSSLEKICKQRGFIGEKYVVVTYDCLSTERNSKEISIIDMTLDSANSIPPDWTKTEVLYMKSTSYPQFTSLPINICQIKVKENTRLEIKILDLYGKNDALKVPQNCSYELLITNKIKSFTKCADQYFNINGVYEYITQNSEDTIQVAFQEKHSGGVPQAKLWLELATYTTSQERWPKTGMTGLECDPVKLSVWTTTTVSSTKTTTTQSPKTTTSTATTTNTRPSQKGSTPTGDSTTFKVVVDPSKPGNDGSSGNGGQNNDPNVGKLENDSIMPIIAGVVAGGLVIIVIVIIIIVLMVRKHYVNHKPAKELDVIDAWDNQSVISAAQQSAKTYKAEQLEPYEMSHSLPISYPRNSGPSFIQQTSMDGDIYAEVPSLPGSKAASEIGNSNKGYENDAYYTGDVDGDIYYNSHKRNGHVTKDSRLSQMYAQPMKKKGQNSAQSGFDDPSWVGNGEVSPGYTDEPEEVYGYTTTLN